MKVRIGIGFGQTELSPALVTGTVDAMQARGFDSLWLSEILTAPIGDPMLGLAWAGAHNPRLKLGTTMLLAGRSPVRLAKELATLDILSAGRLLVTFVPGLNGPVENDAIGVANSDRPQLMDETLSLVRELLEGKTLDYEGRLGSFHGVSIGMRSFQDPLEIWLGGRVRQTLERCGRFYDGWLPSRMSVERAARGRLVVDQSAAEVGREISPEHFGASISYSRVPLDGEAARRIAADARVDNASEIVPCGFDELRILLERYIEVGFSKFVVRPMEPPASWERELDELAEHVGVLQN